MQRIMVVLLACLLAGASTSGTAHSGHYAVVDTRPGVTVPLWVTVPANPFAVAVLFSGGDGSPGITAGGIDQDGNFLIRSRELFADAGMVAVVVDAPSDRRSLRDFRTGEKHAEDIAGVIAQLRRQYNLPVWLVGTSRGTLSAANGAARINAGGPDGIVLSSTVTLPGNNNGETIRDARLKDIRVPVLFAHHEDDACSVCPFHEIERVMKKLKNAPKVELVSFAGGTNDSSNPCSARTYHGFLGIEQPAVRTITDWIRAN